MTCQIELIRKTELQTNTWAGGTTTQLAIYPKDAMYSERNFKWRLSSAKVEVEESTFTFLPDINRVIMIIEGELILEHEGHHRAVLKPFEKDTFSGSWTTKSFGKVTDFNLMTAKGCEGALEAIFIDKDESKSITFKEDGEEEKNFSEYAQALYCVDGHIKVKTLTDVFSLYAGDMLLLEAQENFRGLDLTVHSKENTTVHLIRATMTY